MARPYIIINENKIPTDDKNVKIIDLEFDDNGNDILIVNYKGKKYKSLVYTIDNE